MSHLFDTHTHLHDPRFDQDREKVLQDCQDGLSGWINVGSDLKSSKLCLEYSRQFPRGYASAGVHPHDVKDHSLEDLESIEALYSEKEVVAAGEMGLDFYYDNSPRELQIEVFERQLRAAKKVDLPCIIHVRDAFDEFFQTVDRVGYYHGVVHCFSGDRHQALEVQERGFYAGFGGILTFKNAQETRESMLALDFDRVLLETDCPYLAPVPHRGKRNQPLFVQEVAKKVAELKEMDLDEAIKRTEANAISLFLKA